MTLHFANLTNGTLCAPAGAHYSRIQSTWCEQKRWGDVLWTLPVDIYAALAAGVDVVVHDQSERERLTRAQWQGLSWVRYATRAAWGLPEQRESVRGNCDVTAYWREQWRQLDPRVAKYVSYFRASSVVGSLRACSCDRLAAHLFLQAVPA